MARRKRPTPEPVDARMEALLDLNLSEEEAHLYRSQLGQDIPITALREDPDKQTVWRVLEWLFTEAGSGTMEPDLAAMFDRMLSDYKTKHRIMAYAIGRERLQRIVEQVDLEREISDDLKNALPYMSNENKVKALMALSNSISAGLENLDKLAGVADVSEDVMAALQGHMKDSAVNKPLKEATGEEREAIRKFVESIRDMAKNDQFSTLASEEPDGDAPKVE